MAPLPKPVYADQQIAAANANLCGAYRQVRHALDAAGARNGGSAPIASLAVATASRQALEAGSRYLLAKLAEQSATDSALATATHKLAESYLQIAVSYLADSNDSENWSVFQSVRKPTATIDHLCK